MLRFGFNVCLLGRGVQQPALVEPTFSKTATEKLFSVGDASAEGCLHSVGSSSQSSQSDKFSYSSDSSSAGFRGTVPVELESPLREISPIAATSHHGRILRPRTALPC
ncbi:Set3 complex subunit [Trichinella spiralis]|uniref:Set3 complex subunit n=2 Tax=Trichinella spiralis TaxID=6334 RepID=A0ABR3L0N4_TRISP